MRLRPLVPGPLLVVALTTGLTAGLAGYGEESPDAGSAEEPSPAVVSASAPAMPLEIRAVVATSQAPAPDSLVLQQFDRLDCAAAPAPVPVAEPGAACDDEGTKYSLGPAVVVGDVEDARAEIAPGSELWVVTVELEPGAVASLREVTAELAATRGRLALVVDGVVVSAPTVETPIADGRLQVVGDLDEDAATVLADRIAAG